MKNIDAIQGLWRDSILKQCLYASVLFCTSYGMIYTSLLQPKYQEIKILSKKTLKSYQEVIDNTNNVCRWQKTENTWQITGSFASVYECIVSQDNQQPVPSMIFQKNISGVSVTLNGMPV